MPNVTEGGRTAGLISYLLGAGRANEHTDVHLVAGDQAAVAVFGTDVLGTGEAGAIAAHLDEAMNAFGVRVRGEVYRYDQDAGRRVKVGYGETHVWHCSLSLRAEEGQLDDETWQRIAADFVAEMGFDEPSGVKAPCRWVAVRHGLSKNGNDHIHIVVNRVREDGTKASDFRSYQRAQDVAGDLERRYGLEILESRAAGRATRGLRPAELARMARSGAEPERVSLHRRVRAAATQAVDEAEFVRRARRSGVLVRPRYAKGRSDVVTGYSVALRPPAGQRAIWFGGGQLARDLALPRLREYWPDCPQHAVAAVAEWNAAAAGAPVVAPGAEVEAPTGAELGAMSEQLRAMRERLAGIDPQDKVMWAHVARQASGLLATWSAATEPVPGPLAAAAREVSAYASTHKRGDPARTPGTSALRGLALTAAALDPRTPDHVRAAIVLRQIVASVQALAAAHAAIGQARAAEHLHRVVNAELHAVHTALTASAPAPRAARAPAPVAVLERPAATENARRREAEGAVPVPSRPAEPDPLEELKKTHPDAYAAEVLRRKLFGQMAAPGARPRGGSPAAGETKAVPRRGPAQQTGRDGVER